jgi:hypothetical protein
MEGRSNFGHYKSTNGSIERAEETIGEFGHDTSLEITEGNTSVATDVATDARVVFKGRFFDSRPGWDGAGPRRRWRKAAATFQGARAQGREAIGEFGHETSLGITEGYTSVAADVAADGRAVFKGRFFDSRPGGDEAGHRRGKRHRAAGTFKGTEKERNDGRTKSGGKVVENKKRNKESGEQLVSLVP